MSLVPADPRYPLATVRAERRLGQVKGERSSPRLDAPLIAPAPSAQRAHNASITPREACFVLALKSAASRPGADRRADPALARKLAAATGRDCLAAAFSLADGAMPKSFVGLAHTHEPGPVPFDDTAYYRAIARWLGCAFDGGSRLAEWQRTAGAKNAIAFHAATGGNGMVARLRLRGRRHMVIAPAADWLPRLAALVVRQPNLARRILIAPPQAVCRLAPGPGGPIASAGRIEPLHAIPEREVASSVLTKTQRVAFAAAIVLITVCGLMIPDVLLPFVIIGITLVLICYAASRGLAVLDTRPFAPHRTLCSADLPTYSVLVPLYREDRGLRQLVRALQRLDYPRDKLDILFLVEAHDTLTQAALAREARYLPCRIVIVPPGTPRTKPRALNAGLRQARGEIVTIYDAEDRPHPRQLRLAAETFAIAPAHVAALQARLSIDHMSDNWLTAMFAVEYACLFDRIMPMVASRGRLVLLGGTSNHFRRETLLACGGWDPYNVTEDADLAVRLRRNGYTIAMIDSVTYEEAPVTSRAWLKQRSRWFKGYMQTWLVHNREPVTLLRELGWRDTALLHIFIVGALLAALAHLVFTAQIIGALAGVYAPFSGGYAWLSAFQLAAITFGYGANFAVGAVALASATDHGQRLSPWLGAGFPFYWLLMGAAVLLALHDIVRTPHHWRKTSHGIAVRPPWPQRRTAPTEPAAAPTG